ERVAMIRTEDASVAKWAYDNRRSEGFEVAMSDVGLKVKGSLMVTVPYGLDGGSRAMDILLSDREPPTAVFAYSDEVAIGALRSLRRAHIPVPEQISIVGVDDHPMAELNDLT